MINFSFFYPVDTEAFPSQGKTAIILTYILTALGTGIGSFLLIIARGASYFPEGEIDDLPDFGPLFNLVGTIFLVLAFVSLGVNFLFIHKKKAGWILLTGIYFGGSILTIYVLYLGIRAFIEYSLFALPFPLILLLVVGIVGLYTLLHKNTLGFFFPKILSKVE
ncbi:MAG: hypothetical protein H7641_05050 [Candidatus Heimdallarchaeota archaeon]|nr:hypothetical protein [Candidatus Heimdallarchaeota archaeon]MCK4876927.1 hypothetical protein [Candidatus Heimdallarchaeota archaeon]